MEEGGVFGARGVLINITASSQLGIHDVNEACNLIRAATENEDVQINFGVVLDEKMGSSVKIAVIATGFQRDSLPEIDRRSPHFPFFMTSSMPAGRDAQPQIEPEPEIVVHAATEPDSEPEVIGTRSESSDDYDTPAFLRKQRRSVQ